MKKIPTLFVRDFDSDPRYVTRDVTPGCEWVLKGEGTPTRKYDGTCVMFDGEHWWARREVKEGKTAPDGFVALGTDPETGKTVGWEPAEQSSFWRWIQDAIEHAPDGAWAATTYELCGPKVNGNPEGCLYHLLIEHHAAPGARTPRHVLSDAPRDFDALAGWLNARHYEGIVWHHEDGRMAKLKKRDFPK